MDLVWLSPRAPSAPTAAEALPIQPELWWQRHIHYTIQVIFLGFLAWEILITVPFELRTWRRDPKHPLIWFFSASRYFGLGGHVSNVLLNIANGVTLDYCQRYAFWLPFHDALSHALALPLMMARAWAICGQARTVAAGLVAVYLAALAVAIYGAFTYIGVPFSQVAGLGHYSGGCANDPIDNWGAYVFVAWAAVDGLCFALSTGKILVLWRHSGYKTNLQAILLRDGIQYFLLVTIINVVNVCFLLSYRLPIFLRPTLAGPSGAATIIGSCRLFMNLKVWAVRDRPGALGDCFNAVADPSSDHGGMMRTASNGPARRHKSLVGSFGDSSIPVLGMPTADADDDDDDQQQHRQHRQNDSGFGVAPFSGAGLRSYPGVTSSRSVTSAHDARPKTLPRSEELVALSKLERRIQIAAAAKAAFGRGRSECELGQAQAVPPSGFVSRGSQRSRNRNADLGSTCAEPEEATLQRTPTARSRARRHASLRAQTVRDQRQQPMPSSLTRKSTPPAMHGLGVGQVPLIITEEVEVKWS